MKSPKLVTENVRGKVFVGGLSWETTREGLAHYFSRYGEIIDCVVMKNNVDGRARGFGFVTYSEPSVVDYVLQNGPHKLDGRTIDPKPCNPRSEQEIKIISSGHKLFLGGLPSTVTETDLRTFFNSYGTVSEIVIMYDQKKKKSRGFGFITLKDLNSAQILMAQHFVDISGKQVEIKSAEPRDEVLIEQPISLQNVECNDENSPICYVESVQYVGGGDFVGTTYTVMNEYEYSNAAFNVVENNQNTSLQFEGNDNLNINEINSFELPQLSQNNVDPPFLLPQYSRDQQYIVQPNSYICYQFQQQPQTFLQQPSQYQLVSQVYIPSNTYVYQNWIPPTSTNNNILESDAHQVQVAPAVRMNGPQISTSAPMFVLTAQSKPEVAAQPVQPIQSNFWTVPIAGYDICGTSPCYMPLNVIPAYDASRRLTTMYEY